jgi:hypothetical protein
MNTSAQNIENTIFMVFHLSSFLILDCISSRTLSVEEISRMGEDESELKLPPCIMIISIYENDLTRSHDFY